MRLVPLHPVSTPDPATLRWVVPDGLLPFTGTVGRAPSPLQGLLDDGTLLAVEVTPGAVLTVLSDTLTWADQGPRVRSALLDALHRPTRWSPGQGAVGVGPDEALEAAARQIAQGVVGELAARHGGAFTVVDVRDGVVEVALEGACHDCPAAAVTMQARFAHLLRRRCPWLVEVREHTGTPAPTG